MHRPNGGRTFLGIGQDAPPPSGPEDADLKAALLAQARATIFRFRVNLWSFVTGHGAFNWEEFEHRLLERTEFKNYANWQEAIQSLGWAGLTEKGDNWLFGVWGYRIPLYGKSAMRHEIFHGVQDQQYGLFTDDAGLLRSLAAEYSAHFWGGPLIGIPIAYGGTGFIVCGTIYLAYLLTALISA